MYTISDNSDHPATLFANMSSESLARVDNSSELFPGNYSYNEYTGTVGVYIYYIHALNQFGTYVVSEAIEVTINYNCTFD